MYEPRVSLGKQSSINFKHALIARKALGIQLNLFGASIYRLGNDNHRRNYMKEIEKYNVIGGFCLTEVGRYP